MMQSPEFHKNYKPDERLRNSFFDFTPKVFSGLSFKDWYDRGGWGSKYIPYSYITETGMIANVSISEMTIMLNGKDVNAIQFATVGTLPEYRGQGLSRKLMEAVLSDYADKVDLMFLFANETVMDFYPKFGFRHLSESVFSTPVNKLAADFQARKLDIDDGDDFEILRRLAATRIPVTERFGARNYGNILLWHALNILPDDLWYLADDDILIAFGRDGNRLEIYDILSAHPFSLSALLPKILTPDIEHIDLYFSPDCMDIEFSGQEFYHDSPLFVRGDFPLEGMPFKFPALAQT